MGRLDHLVEAVFERYKDRYFCEESAFPPAMNSPGTETMLQRSMSTLKETSTNVSSSIFDLTDPSQL
jgi:hypothetical protein